eukprot:scaffold28859_cov41-Attheya_sp.AAC.1
MVGITRESIYPERNTKKKFRVGKPFFMLTCLSFSSAIYAIVQMNGTLYKDWTDSIIGRMMDKEIVDTNSLKWDDTAEDSSSKGGLLILDTQVSSQQDPPTNGMLNNEVSDRIASKWDNAQDTFAKGGAWHQHPLVVSEYKKRLAAGHDNMVSHILTTYGKKDKCLSIGCGDGGIEIEMVRGGLCSTIKGIDLSPVRIARADENIPDDLKDKIEFKVENAERVTQGNEYDMVLFTHALHHIFDLESMVTVIKERIMKKSGILVLEEYVGPVRWQFPPHHLALMATFLQDLEAKYPHKVEALRQNSLWDGINFVPPDATAIEKDDPSETVRSNEIVPVLSNQMSIVEDVPLGGNLFQWIFHNVYNSLKDEEGLLIVESMLNAEMEAIKDGKIASDYVLQVWKHTEAETA